MCVHNSPLASPADLRSLGWSVFDSWLLLAAVLVSSRPGVLPSTGGVGVAETRHWPGLTTAQGSTGGCEDTLAQQPPPSTQVGEDRL